MTKTNKSLLKAAPAKKAQATKCKVDQQIIAELKDSLSKVRASPKSGSKRWLYVGPHGKMAKWFTHDDIDNAASYIESLNKPNDKLITKKWYINFGSLNRELLRHNAAIDIANSKYKRMLMKKAGLGSKWAYQSE